MVNFDRFKNLVNDAKSIVITTHISPDADGIGSQIALSHALKIMGKAVFCVNQEKLETRYSYLDNAKIVEGFNKTHLKKLAKVDLFIIVDANSIERIGEGLKTISQTSKELLFIDHHPTNDEFTALHCIDTTSAATGEIVSRLIEQSKIPFSYEMGLALYTSIIIDTSSFQYPTVSPETHKTVAKLLSAGNISSPSDERNLRTKQYSFLSLSRKSSRENKINRIQKNYICSNHIKRPFSILCRS